jgi:hypothetical protein
VEFKGSDALSKRKHLETPHKQRRRSHCKSARTVIKAATGGGKELALTLTPLTFNGCGPIDDVLISPSEGHDKHLHWQALLMLLMSYCSLALGLQVGTTVAWLVLANRDFRALIPQQQLHCVSLRFPQFHVVLNSFITASCS